MSDIIDFMHMFFLNEVGRKVYLSYLSKQIILYILKKYISKNAGGNSEQITVI